eukprot:8517830-Alexandrium_andersonii.AAC.1
MHGRAFRPGRHPSLPLPSFALLDAVRAGLSLTRRGSTMSRFGLPAPAAAGAVCLGSRTCDPPLPLAALRAWNTPTGRT